MVQTDAAVRRTASASEAAVQVTALTKRFGDVPAVDGITFAVSHGEVFAFLGPNGAGKSTTINVLCTLARPTGGSARVAGYDVATQPRAVRRRIGLVFQEPTLEEQLTAEENSGKIAGGATVATVQGSIMLALAPLIGVHLTAVAVVQVVALEFLMAVAMTALGVFVASRVEKIEGFQVVIQLLLLPMLFLSGALFPVAGLPGWLTLLTRVNPLTYAVAPLRTVVFEVQDMPPAAAARFSATLSLFGHRLTLWSEVGIVVGFIAVFFTLAVLGFRRTS